LISQLLTKIGIVHFSNEARNVSLMFFNHKFTTDITKTVWRVHTTTTWHVRSTTQCKIKLRLKNERALTANLEHEEVLSHSLLDFFSNAMLVQQIATKGANSIYSSHMKKTPSVRMYTELKIVGVLRYLYLYTVWTVHINTVWKFDFVKKWYVIGHCKCHFVFQHTKIHEEELNFSKSFLVASLCY
jgi:hypothetical protein